MNKKIQVSFDEEEYRVFSSCKGASKDATKAKNIIMAWLHEKTFVKDHSVKQMNDEENWSHGASK